jgi:hypothetical protein
MIKKTVRAFCEGLIDDASLLEVPPGRLGEFLPDHLERKNRQVAGGAGWMVGRTLLTVHQLPALEASLARLEREVRAPAKSAVYPSRWGLLCADMLEVDSWARVIEQVVHFQERFAEHVACIDHLVLHQVPQIPLDLIGAKLSDGMAGHRALSCSVALPDGPEFSSALPLLAENGLGAFLVLGHQAGEKVISSPPLWLSEVTRVAEWIVACASEDVPFTCSALTAPVLTREGSAAALGFLNLFLAAVFAQTGMPAGEVAEILCEEDPTAFRWETDAVFWRQRMVVVSQVRNMRHLFALSFHCAQVGKALSGLEAAGLLRQELSE